jgi:hypothetical protein
MCEKNKKNFNGLRCKKLVFLKKKNILMKNDIEKRMLKMQLNDNEVNILNKLTYSLSSCSSFSLFGDNGQEIKLISSRTCGHKLCHICNWNRQKKIRRKYFRWFENNKTINKIVKDDVIKYVTNANVKKYPQYTVVDDKLEYDLMHLTLTVPHSEKGWRSKKLYFSEIMNAYNIMRKYDFWQEQVYGGEFGVETTKNKSGCHIHIHSLLFVAKRRMNRNLLHLDILRHWNGLTVDKESSRTAFSEDACKAIKKGNKLIDEKYISKLKPQGATLIGLECIYTLNKDGFKVRSNSWNSDEMMKAVLETISYHFKPKLFEFSDNLFDVKLIVEMLPKVYRKVLYRKFGCLHGEKSLNVKDDSLLNDYDETSEMVDEETGEVLQMHYFSTNPLNVYVKGDENDICIQKNADVINLNARNGREAVKQLVEMSMSNGKYQKGWR